MNEQEQQHKHEHKHTNEQHIENMAQPVATIDIERNCAVLTFSPTHVFLLDYSAYNRYVTAGHKFSFQTLTDAYPSYVVNYKPHTLLDFVVQHGTKDMTYHYRNGNERDLRAHNLQVIHRFDSVVRERYKDLDVQYIPGHVNVMGTGANMMKNPLWRIGQHQIVMFVEPNRLCLLCPEGLERIRVFERAHNAGKRLTFFCNGNGQVFSSLNCLMHEILTNAVAEKKTGTNLTVHYQDHDPLNNTLINLIMQPSEEMLHELNWQRIDSVVKEKYNVLEFIPGHMNNVGKDANKMKNPLWRCQLPDGGEQFIMFVEKDTLCLLCPEGLERIRVFERAHNSGKPVTFFCTSAGYVTCSLKLYMHQIIMDLHGNGRGTMTISVDHLDQNPLNNMLANLRIATREEQEQNSNGIKPDTKRRRMHYARALPAGIKQEDLRKNVVYYSEVYNKEKGLTREFFKVEGHPKLDKPWCSSKSGQVDVRAKLASANLVVDNLARGVFPEAPDNGLPNYVSLNINTVASKSHLIYERRVKPDVRQSLKMVIPAEYVLAEQLAKLNQKVIAKYGAEFNLI